MSKGKVKKFLTGLLCVAMLVGNQGSTIAFAATGPVIEETQEETALASEETQDEGTLESVETQEEVSSESEETSETSQPALKKPVFSGDWTKSPEGEYALIGLGGV